MWLKLVEQVVLHDLLIANVIFLLNNTISNRIRQLIIVSIYHEYKEVQPFHVYDKI